MSVKDGIRLQARIFSLVAAAFSTIYITQPVLPVLQAEFGVSASRASLTVSAVIFGIAISTLPFGMLADRRPVRPIILAGGSVIAALSLFCAVTRSLPLLVSARFLQGLLVPSVTACVVVHLVRTLPADRLNVVMGSYVSATVAGGLGGRLLGGLIHSPLHWRYAFVTVSIFLLLAVADAVRWLPARDAGAEDAGGTAGFRALLCRTDLLRLYLVAFGSFAVFSSVFNYLPFHLAGPPFGMSTRSITLMYVTYAIGAFIGPLAGRLSDRIGNGATMAVGSAVFAFAVLLTLVPSALAVTASLGCVCAGFFSVHAAAVGALNRRLAAGRGRANSLYVLFYYLGGFAGITASGQAYAVAGWRGVTVLGVLVLAVPFTTGVLEMRGCRAARRDSGTCGGPSSERNPLPERKRGRPRSG